MTVETYVTGELVQGRIRAEWSLRVCGGGATTEWRGRGVLMRCGKAQYKGEACTLPDFAVNRQFGVQAFEQVSHN